MPAAPACLSVAYYIIQLFPPSVTLIEAKELLGSFEQLHSPLHSSQQTTKTHTYNSLNKQLHTITHASVTLIEAKELLGSFDASLREYAARKLTRQGIKLRKVWKGLDMFCKSAPAMSIALLLMQSDFCLA